MIKRSVHEWLELWGEWERCGRAYLAHLQPKSSMGIYMDTVLPTDKAPLPELNDEEAEWFCSIMTRFRRSRPRLFELLLWIHARQLSLREVASRLDVNRHRVGEMYERAIGWVESLTEAQYGLDEIQTKKRLQGGRH